MARYRRLKKVSWAPDGNLCQIRQFSSEDCPSKVGLLVDESPEFQHLQRSQFNLAYNNPPPGFSRSSMKKSEKLVHIPVIRWKCPPKVNLNPSWVVSAGEQSEEVYLQKQRELTVFEAVYPRLTDIPHSPSSALCKDRHVPDDRTIPTIRITPIEDDEAPLGSSFEACQKLPVISVSQPPGFPNTNQHVNSVQTPQAGGTQRIVSCDEADVGDAASAALTALLRSSEIGSSVDTDILIDIFNNPETVSMLLNMPKSANQKLPPKTTLEQVPSSVTFSSPSPDIFSPSASGNWGSAQNPTHWASATFQPGYVTDTIAGAKAVTSPPSNFGGPVFTPSPMPTFGNRTQLKTTPEVFPQTRSVSEISPYFSRPPPQVKDANYYKNLIKQHGLDNNKNFQGNIPRQQMFHGLTKNSIGFAKNLKPCMFFKTPKGCRKGLDCPFRHDMMIEAPNAKRMKLVREQDLIINLI